MKYPLSFMAFVAIVLLQTQSCHTFQGPRIHGSGIAASEVRETEDFDRLSVSGAIQAVVRVGEEHHVILSGDDNILPHVRTTVRSGKLELSMKHGSYSPELDIVAEISVPTLRSVKTSGASRLEVVGLDASRFDVNTSGASAITASGHADDLRINASGASQLDLYGLRARTADLRLSGASDAEVFATELLDARTSGASSIRYRGTPMVEMVGSGMSSLQAE